MSKMGVVFHERDYAGFFRRICTLILDSIFLFIILITVSMTLEIMGVPKFSQGAFATLIFFSGYLYLTLLKAVWGTPGQWITGVKVLNLKGEVPSLLMMSLRLVFWAFGPFNLLLDFAWMSFNKERRTLRDSICETLVVRRKAQPLGEAAIVYAKTSALGIHIVTATTKP